jgi:acylphosphatase
MKTQVHVIISGIVQGVWYRASTKQKAEQLGLTGWVKNTPEGNVEAVFEGDDEQVVKEMVAWCWKGPPHAKVTDVRVKHEQGVGSFKEFSVLRK